ncbi:hypothetical protein HY214_00150 [Candidatus Roizmanbacteria bacterium]|nr:hypothetical protein [Candidatus Roizmanbacteria bacterium]
MGTAGSIEDIFSPSDFKQFVLNDVGKTYTGTNAEYVKKAKLDKVLLAKKFLETCQNGTSISLDKTTMDNINKLIENIEGKF